MKIRYAIPAVAAAALLLAGCVTNTEATSQGGTERVSVEADAAASALVPKDIRDTGELVIGVHTLSAERVSRFGE